MLAPTVNPGGVPCWSAVCRSAADGVLTEGLAPPMTAATLEMLPAGDAAAGLGWDAAAGGAISTA